MLFRALRGGVEEVTREETFGPGEQRYRVVERLRRLDELGFAVDELQVAIPAVALGLR